MAACGTPGLTGLTQSHDSGSSLPPREEKAYIALGRWAYRLGGHDRGQSSSAGLTPEPEPSFSLPKWVSSSCKHWLCRC